MCLLAVLCFGQVAVSQALKKDVEVGNPSLDLLVARIDSFWNLLLQRNKLQAAECIDPSGREQFVEQSISPFSDAKLRSLELSADRTEAKVVIMVKRRSPVSADVLTVPVSERWAFKGDNWYLQLDPVATPFSGVKRQSTKADQEEADKSELRRMLQFEPSVLDFGMVRRGEPVNLNLRYSLAGSEALSVKIEKSIPALEIKGLSGPQLLPGKPQDLAVKMRTEGCEGIVLENITLTVRWKKVDVAFKISIQGFVQAPVSVAPKHLRLNSGTENREKVIAVRNDSNSTLELKSFSSKTGAIAVEPLPLTIPAGRRLELKVRQIREVGKPETPEILEIAFARPIENMGSLIVNVVLDAVEKKDGSTYDPAKDPALREQIRKILMNSPKR